MNNKRKNRSGPNNRLQRGRTVSAQGVYNNSFFMHAATSFVGNLVQVQTHSGSIYEGVFKTFSPTFEVAIELAQCIKNSSQKEKSDDNDSLTECMVFHPNHIVSIVSKDVDPDFATGGTFQTDSAISRFKCLSRREEKELEPWDASGGVNGEVDLQLDGNANGWDANDMFNKNEKLYGVQSTYDNSLAGYTVPIEKKDTQEFKIAEAEAEKIAQEIENNPNSKERLDLENGDEEQRFAAVERPTQQGGGGGQATVQTPTSAVGSASSTPTVDISPDISQQVSQSNCNTMSKGSNSADKFVLPPKRKNIQTNKLVRSTPPPNNNNGPLSQHSSHSNSKNNNYQSMQLQSNSPYALNQNYSHMHGHSSNMSQSKINGEGGNNNSNNKPLPQRSIRQYPQQSNNSVSYSDQALNMSGQMSMGKPPVHVSHNHAHVGNQHMSNNMQESPPPPQQASIMYQPMQMTPNQSGPPPQPQRQPRAKEETIQGLLKFHQDFHLASSNQQQQQPQQQQQQQMNQVKTPSVSPHQQPQPSLSPPQTHQQQLSPMPQHPSQSQQPPQHLPHHQQQQQQPPQQQQQQPHPSQQQQQQPQHQPQQQQQQQQHQHQHQQSHQQQQQHTQQHSQQQQTDNSAPLQQSQKGSQSHHQQQQTDQQSGYQSGPPNQQQSPPTIISPNASCSSISSAPTSITPPQQAQQVVNTSTSSSGNESNLGEKPLPAGPVKKTHQLNPAAKPFTPRSPSTPNPSRPHTPQTPGPAMAPGVYTAGPHVAAGQVAYVMQPQPSFQTAPHPHAGQQGRIRRDFSRLAPIAASQMQVSAAAATGQPLLTAAPIQQIFHYQQSPHPQHFQSQPYQHMVRMYHEPPPQQIQFLTQTPPSTTPSPGQPHQQFHPGPQPSPAGGGPPAFGPAAQPTPHFPMMCPVIPQLVPNYYQGAAQTPHHAQQFQVIMQQQHPAP